MLWALSDPALTVYLGSSGAVGRPWPYLAQVCRVERQRVVVRTGGVVTKDMRDVTSSVTSQPPTHAEARTLARQIRGHWGIEHKSHWLRDETFGEDACQTRTGAAPQVRAACLNLAIALLRRTGVTNLAAALRTDAGRPACAVHLIASARENMRTRTVLGANARHPRRWLRFILCVLMVSAILVLTDAAPDTATPVAAQAPTLPLTVTLSGDGSGVVTSSPAGISCPTDCEES